MTPEQRRHVFRYDPDRDDRGLWLAVAWTLVVLNIAAPIALVFIAGGAP